MKKQNAMQIRVQEPCMQSWSDMKEESNGRYCGACSQIVTDFTGYTDEELIQFFSTESTGRVCGRFRENQVSNTRVTSRQGWIWLRTLAAVLIPLLFSSKSEAQQQDSIPKKMDTGTHDTMVQKWRTVMGMPIRDRFIPIDPSKRKQGGREIKRTDRRKEEE
jgi:hypothetical protein